MGQRPLRQLTIRAAMILGFGLTLSLWFFIGSQFARRSAEVEDQSTSIAARYVQAQERLAAIRGQILGISGAVRDALFDVDGPTSAHAQEFETRLEQFRTGVDAYVLVQDSADERAGLTLLQHEAARFEAAMRVQIGLSSRPEDPRATFRAEVLPRREDMLRRSEELQATNRADFVRYQRELDTLHASSER